MSKWKLQAVEPDTCEGVAQGQGCRYIELWDVEADPLTRTHTVVSFDRVCAVHQDTVVTDKILWADGNWKDKKAYIEYQRAWFRHQNYLEWQQKHPDEAMPPQIASHSSEPATTGSVTPPQLLEVDGMNRVYQLNLEHNTRKNQILVLAEAEGIDRKSVTYRWEGRDSSRVLRVTLPGSQLSKGRIQSASDIQFGPGKVVVE